jgi:hypothetical protein
MGEREKKKITDRWTKCQTDEQERDRRKDRGTERWQTDRENFKKMAGKTKGQKWWKAAEKTKADKFSEGQKKTWEGQKKKMSQIDKILNTKDREDRQIEQNFRKM